MMAIRLIASSFSPRFVVLLVVVLKAQAVPRRLRRPRIGEHFKTGLRGLLSISVSCSVCIPKYQRTKVSRSSSLIINPMSE
jgi:hypothetical protein